MGYLDNAGLAHFTAWVKSRLLGKQDALTPDETVIMRDGGIGVALPTKTVTQAEYDALTDAQKQAEVLYAVTDDSPGGGSGGGEVYSTEEIRIGTWIDGKPLYRQVIQFPDFSIQTSINQEVASGIMEGKDLVRAYGVAAKETELQTEFPLPYVDTTGLFIAIQRRGNNLVLRHQWFETIHVINVNVVIEYTKTTD